MCDKTDPQWSEDAEMLQDIRDYDAAMQAIADGEELIPGEVVNALVDGGNPIRVWREYRGMTQAHLAKVAEISVPYLSQLESGKRTGSPGVLGAIARGLDLALDDLIGWKATAPSAILERVAQAPEEEPMSLDEINALLHETR
ncbi:MAG: helix-turn-helix transcriptional regulator [Anaerolineae bacterium]|nr:helix-turn-helix transcriptional regulator [Anaerolineae bacterium]